MPILEFEPSDELLAICDHAIAAKETRDRFCDEGSGAGLILGADWNGVYLMSNGTLPLAHADGRPALAHAVGGNPASDPGWSTLVSDVSGEKLPERWVVDWARIIRHQIRQKTGRIRILSTDDELEMLYQTATGGIPHKRKSTT